jgi:hypothetical protein
MIKYFSARWERWTEMDRKVSRDIKAAYKDTRMPVKAATAPEVH